MGEGGKRQRREGTTGILPGWYVIVVTQEPRLKTCELPSGYLSWRAGQTGCRGLCPDGTPGWKRTSQPRSRSMLHARHRSRSRKRSASKVDSLQLVKLAGSGTVFSLWMSAEHGLDRCPESHAEGHRATRRFQRAEQEGAGAAGSSALSLGEGLSANQRWWVSRRGGS